MAKALPFVLLCFPARGEESPTPTLQNRSVSTIGLKGDLSVAAGGASDLDLLLYQRLRWKVLPTLPGDTRLWIDGRLTLDTNGEVLLERSRVTRLGTTTQSGKLEMSVGRSNVKYGGPRLVDGLQGLWSPNATFAAGAWGGLAPDLFTTLPRARYGGGVIASFNSFGFRGSMTTETLIAEGALDRAGALFQLRFETLPTISFTSRLDVQLGPDSERKIADAAVMGSLVPSAGVKLSADYHAYSSYRYLETQDLDPGIQRFSKRVVDLGLVTGIPQDSPDETLYHQAGTSARWSTELENGVRPSAALLLRGRTTDDPLKRYVMVSPSAGAHDLFHGRFGATVDANFRLNEAFFAGDAGTTFSVQSTGESDWMVDTSVRLLFSPAYEDFPGLYSDVFVDFSALDSLVFSAGVYAAFENDEIVDELSFGGFLLASFRARTPRPLQKEALP